MGLSRINLMSRAPSVPMDQVKRVARCRPHPARRQLGRLDDWRILVGAGVFHGFTLRPRGVTASAVAGLVMSCRD